LGCGQLFVGGEVTNHVTINEAGVVQMSTVAALMPRLGWPTFFEEPVMLLAFVLLGRAVEERAKLQVPYGDQKVANRDIRVWHGATEKGP
jgi:cation transport ATPase